MTALDWTPISMTPPHGQPVQVRRQQQNGPTFTTLAIRRGRRWLDEFGEPLWFDPTEWRELQTVEAR